MSQITLGDSPERDDDQVMIVEEKPAQKKVLEEDEYLNRMAHIIRRDFFSTLELSTETPSYGTSERSVVIQGTPASDITSISSTSSMKSRKEACEMNLNKFLDHYTSEDNAYFEKLQNKDLRKHRMKYPWLYSSKDNYNERIDNQLKLPSCEKQVELGDRKRCTEIVDWHHNPKNTLFHPPEAESRLPQTTINYNSNKYLKESVFKEPLPPGPIVSSQPKNFNRFKDKVGIDGKLIDSSETPSINGFSFIPTPGTPSASAISTPRHKPDANKFFMVGDSKRDELANRLYQEKVAKRIKTPARDTNLTPSSSRIGTPASSRGSYASFSFNPERVRNYTPGMKRGK